MELFDEVFECLRDGKNHTLYELAIRTKIGQLELSKGMSILRFLQKYGFIHFHHLYTVRLSRPVCSFLTKISLCEEAS